MAFKSPPELHHNFVKLAEESGFTFSTHKSRNRIDWNKIRQVDVDNLIRDRKFFLIEQHVNDILTCALETEFDVRILDEGVVKMFRLAQLTIEYQQFCRHYLDRSVYVLRDELSSVMQQLEAARKYIREKDEEIKKHKRKSKQNFRPPLMYGNDNIANLILKTLSNNGEMLPTTSGLFDLSHQYNKCNYCDKAFLNQLYLKSHVTRRHAHITEISQKESLKRDLSPVQKDEVKDEITELKSKLKEMETSLTHMTSSRAITVDTGIQSNINEAENNNVSQEKQSLNIIENNLLEQKLESWKKEEHDKYKKEIDSLRTQIIETIISVKDTPVTNQAESILIQQLQQTIREQGQQIVALTREISDNNNKAEKEKRETSKEIEVQLKQWMQKVDVQTQQQERLVQRLNDVAKEAQKARATAEAERSRAAQLATLLEQRTRLSEKTVSSPELELPDKHVNDSKQQLIRRDGSIHYLQTEATEPIVPSGNDIAKANRTSKLTPQRKTLDELHQKAQELLSMKSSSSSENSSSEKLNHSPKLVKTVAKGINGVKTNNRIKQTKGSVNNRVKNQEKKSNQARIKIKSEITQKKLDEKSKLISSEKVYQVHDPVIPRSPVKVIRAKLTEEVNNHLVAAGVDPLKSGLHSTDYNKQRLQLQQEQRLKTKKNPEFDKVRNSIIAFLDSRAGVETLPPSGILENIPVTKMSKAFSLTSVISNVKNKALSLVKHNELNKKERKGLTGDVAKRAIALLKTPPGSVISSPTKMRGSHRDTQLSTEAIISTRKHVDSSPARSKDNKQIIKARKPPVVLPESNDDLSDATLSDHKYNESSSLTKSAKSINNLIKSPIRRPSTANGEYSKNCKEAVDEKALNLKSLSVSNVSEITEGKMKIHNEIQGSSTKDAHTKTINFEKRNALSEDAHTSPKQAKGVLKNAPSTNSLNKKKVLFDMDAIQMKSVSASPSQSTEKSETNEKYELGLVNLDDDEWDISSIDNEPLKNSGHEVKLNLPLRASPKIAELKQTIESQLAHRKTTLSVAPVGGVDMLKGPVTKVASIGGSNTTLGSSIFEDDTAPVLKHTTQIKPRLQRGEKDDSELDLSDFSIDGLTDGKRDSF